MIRREDILTKENIDIQDRYRAVFTTLDGKWVLGHMLGYLGLLEDIRLDHLEEDATMRNVAVWLLDTIGLNHEEQLALITEALLTVPSYRPTEEEAANHGN